MADIRIVKGSTFLDTLRWASEACSFAKAMMIPDAPLILQTTEPHNIPDGWMVQIEGSRDIEEDKTYPVRVEDEYTLEVGCMNGIRFKAVPVVVRYRTPIELEGYRARMQIRDRIDGEILLSFTSENEVGEARILINDEAKTIVREVPALVTEALTWKKGVFDLEMVQGSYVIKIDSGAVTVAEEVTK
jgi:hypothetical protein